MSKYEENKTAHIERLKKQQAEAAAKHQELAAQEQITQTETEVDAGAGVAPPQVQPTEVDTGEIERLKAEIEALKQAQQSGGNAAVPDVDDEALPDERLEKYREALGDDVAALLAEDLVATRRAANAKIKETESKLQRAERYNGYMSKVDAPTLKAFNSPEFQQFAKNQKLGRKLTLADELNEINTNNDIEGAEYLASQVRAWQETQKVTRKASSQASAPVSRFSAPSNVVTQSELSKLSENVRRQRPGTPAFVEAKKAYDEAKLQFTEGLKS